MSIQELHRRNEGCNYPFKKLLLTMSAIEQNVQTKYPLQKIQIFLILTGHAEWRAGWIQHEPQTMTAV